LAKASDKLPGWRVKHNRGSRQAN